MPATVDIMRWTGAAGAPVFTPIGGLNTRANAEDSPTSTTGNPVQIPPVGTTNYSYWVATRLKCTLAPANGIANLRWYAGGSNNFAAGVGCIGNEASAYVQATGTTGTGNLLSTSSYSTLLAAPVDVFVNFTVANPKGLQGALAGGATGDIGNFFIYQITVASNTLPGSSGQTTFTWKYDET